MKIKFIQDYQQHKDGEEVELPAAQAKTLIFRGYAQALPPETSVATAVSADAPEAVAPAKRPPARSNEVRTVEKFSSEKDLLSQRPVCGLWAHGTAGTIVNDT